MDEVRMMARVAAPLVRERLSRAVRPRVPEPMVMDDEASVAAFHVAHPFLQLPVYRLNARALHALLPDGGRLLDLGSGTGRLLAHLAEARPDVSIVGIDLADTMLNVGRRWLEDAGLADRVALRKVDMTALPDDLPTHVDAVSCVWALHHLPTPEHVVDCLREIARIRSETGCAVWIFDFARYRREETFKVIIDVAEDAPPRLVEDGLASERAAWTPEELRQCLGEAGLGAAQGGRERVIGWSQAYFLPHHDDGRPPGPWRGPPLDRATERLATRLRQGLPAFPSS